MPPACITGTRMPDQQVRIKVENSVNKCQKESQYVVGFYSDPKFSFHDAHGPAWQKNHLCPIIKRFDRLRWRPVTINKNSPTVWFALTASMFVVAAFAPCNALAQQEVVNTLEEVVVVGTRRQGRTAVESAVPVACST